MVGLNGGTLATIRRSAQKKRRTVLLALAEAGIHGEDSVRIANKLAPPPRVKWGAIFGSGSRSRIAAATAADGRGPGSGGGSVGAA